MKLVKITRLRRRMGKPREKWNIDIKIVSPVAMWHWGWWWWWWRHPFDSSQMEMSHCNITLPTDFYEFSFFPFSSHLRQTYRIVSIWKSTAIFLLENKSETRWNETIYNVHMSLSQAYIRTSTRLSPHRESDGYCVLTCCIFTYTVALYSMYCTVYKQDQAVLSYNRMQSSIGMKFIHSSLPLFLAHTLVEYISSIDVHLCIF